MPFQPNENLTGALRASLRLVDKEAKTNGATQGATQIPPKGYDEGRGQNRESPEPILHSPLAEVEADSIEEELDRINQGFIQGVPEKITDARLASLVDLYRAQALKWEQEEQTKKTKTRSGTSPKKSHIEALKL